MRMFLALAALCVSATVVVGYPQSQSVDPAYLRQYYAHLAQANREGQEATPIYESGNSEQVYKKQGELQCIRRVNLQGERDLKCP